MRIEIQVRCPLVSALFLSRVERSRTAQLKLSAALWSCAALREWYTVSAQGGERDVHATNTVTIHRGGSCSHATHWPPLLSIPIAQLPPTLFFL